MGGGHRGLTLAFSLPAHHLLDDPLRRIDRQVVPGGRVFLVFPTDPGVLAASIAACALFLAACRGLRVGLKRQSARDD